MIMEVVKIIPLRHDCRACIRIRQVDDPTIRCEDLPSTLDCYINLRKSYILRRIFPAESPVAVFNHDPREIKPEVKNWVSYERFMKSSDIQNHRHSFLADLLKGLPNPELIAPEIASFAASIPSVTCVDCGKSTRGMSIDVWIVEDKYYVESTWDYPISSTESESADEEQQHVESEPPADDDEGLSEELLLDYDFDFDIDEAEEYSNMAVDELFRSAEVLPPPMMKEIHL